MYLFTALFIVDVHKLTYFLEFGQLICGPCLLFGLQNVCQVIVFDLWNEKLKRQLFILMCLW